MTDSKQSSIQPLWWHPRELTRFEIDTPTISLLNSFVREHRGVELPNGVIAFLSQKPDDVDDDSSSISSVGNWPSAAKSTADDESNVFYDNVDNDTSSCEKESVDYSQQRNRFSLVSVSIGVGRLREPADCRGLAELCLQLILLGCSHPEMLSQDDNFDDSAIQKIDVQNWHQDSHYHAEVFDDRSECSFVVDSDLMPKVMQSLGASLRSPVFSEMAIERERKSRRRGCRREALQPLDLLERSSGNPDHPYNRLVLNNESTWASLGSEELRKRLLEFHTKYYSASLLRVAVVSSKSLDQLEEIIATAFENMPKVPVPRIRFDSHPYDGSETGVKIRTDCLNSRFCDTIEIVFPMPDQSLLYKSSPDIYASLLLQNKKQQCSLEACLYRHGLGFCDVGLLDRGTLGFDSFHICIKGMKKVRNYEDRTIMAVFRYLAMLRKLGPQEWLFAEARREGQKAIVVGPNDWDYYPFARSNFSLQRFPFRDLLTAHRVPTEYSPQVISNFLSLLTPDRCKVFIFEPGVNNCSSKYGQPCPHIGAVPHNVEKLAPDFLAACSADWPSPNSEFDADFGIPEPGSVDSLSMQENEPIPSQDGQEANTALSRIANRLSNLSTLPSIDYSFRGIELTNGVQAILVSRRSLGNDSQDKSLICTSLGIGRLHDPTEFRGLAELCHRLTLVGSNTRVDDGLSEILLENRCEEHIEYSLGVLDDQSVYKFLLPASQLPESLSRLSSGIQSPLLSTANIERVFLSGQFRRQIPALDWLERSSGNQSHPYNRMAQNSERTIRSYTAEQLQARLVEFHAQNYSANLLKLAVVDNRPLDELEKIVAAKFGSMPNLSIPRLKLDKHPYDGSMLGVKVRSNSLSLGRKLCMIFPLPEQTSFHWTSPDLFVSYLINNKCKGSISDCLEKRYLSTSVCGQLISRGSVGFDSYCVTVVLQNKELEMIATENKIITIVFRYLAMLRQVGPLEWLYNTFRVERRRGHAFDDENLSGLRWRLNPLQYYCDQPLQFHMQRYSLEHLFTARYALQEYQPDVIKEFLSFLKPENCKVFVSALQMDESHTCSFLTPDGRLCCESEGSDYFSLEKLHSDLMTTCSAAWPSSSCEFDGELKLPKQNLFLCSDFSLRPEEIVRNNRPGPRLLRLHPSANSAAARLWFRQDNRLQTPMAFISVDLVTWPEPIVTDCASSVMLDILIILLAEELGRLENQAKQADLRLKISRSKQGIQVCCSGYRQPLPTFVAAVVSRIFELQITEAAFRKARRKVSATEAQKTHKTDLCKSQLALLLNSACSWHWSYQDKRTAINEATLDGFLKFAQRFCSQIQLSQSPQKQLSEDDEEEDKKTDAAIAVMSLWSRISLAEDEEVVEESSALQETSQDQELQQQQIPRQLFAEILVYGNVIAKDAIVAAQTILNALPTPKPTSAEITLEAVKRRVYLLPSGSHHALLLTISANYKRKSACAIALQVPKPVPTADMNFEFEEAVRQDCIFYLLIEVLQCRGESINHHLDGAIKILIQRNYHTYVVTFDAASGQHPTVIEEQVEAYIDIIGDYISSMPDESFKSCLDSMERSLRREIPVTVQEQHDSYWRGITHGVLRFDRNENLAKYLDSVMVGITKESVLELWRSYLKRGSPIRRKLCIHRISRAAFPDGISEADYANYPGTIIRNRELFKKNLLLSPLPSAEPSSQLD